MARNCHVVIGWHHADDLQEENRVFIYDEVTTEKDGQLDVLDILDNALLEGGFHTKEDRELVNTIVMHFSSIKEEVQE